MTTAAQTITLNGRTYTFTTDGADTRANFRTLGSLTNSRGQFAGFVCEAVRTGRRQVLTASGRGLASVAAERAALAPLTV